MATLIGRWRLKEADSQFGLDAGALAHFKDNGELIYTIPHGEGSSVIRLTYSVVGSRLLTNQPSSPREESTEFRLDGDTLLLIHHGAVARFMRTP